MAAGHALSTPIRRVPCRARGRPAAGERKESHRMVTTRPRTTSSRLRRTGAGLLTGAAASLGTIS